MEMTISKNRIIVIAIIFIVLLSGLSTAIFIKHRQKVKQYKELKDNYFSVRDSIQTFQNINLTLTTKAIQLSFKTKELQENIDSKDSLIQKLNFTIKNQKLKIKDIESILFATLQTSNQGTVVYVDTITVYQTPDSSYRFYRIDDGYLFQNLYLYNDSLQWDYFYAEDINIVHKLERKPNKKGKPVFFLWRWVRPFVKTTLITPSNSKSKIVIATEVELRK